MYRKYYLTNQSKFCCSFDISNRSIFKNECQKNEKSNSLPWKKSPNDDSYYRLNSFASTNTNFYTIYWQLHTILVNWTAHHYNGQEGHSATLCNRKWMHSENIEKHNSKRKFAYCSLLMVMWSHPSDHWTNWACQSQ